MNASSDLSKQIILDKLRKTESTRKAAELLEPDWTQPVFEKPVDLLKSFTSELETLAGKVIYCENEAELKTQLSNLLQQKGLSTLFCRDTQLTHLFQNTILLENKPDQFLKMQVAITRCEALIAKSGSILVSSAHESGRLLNVFPPIHMVVAYENQLVPFIEDALKVISHRYSNNLPSQITLVSGASRTADIEKTLVMGAHGPKELIVFIVKS